MVEVGEFLEHSDPGIDLLLRAALELADLQNVYWLLIGDVGWNEWEDLELCKGGENFGWPHREGAHPGPGGGCPGDDGIDPIWEYHHDIGKSITGGFVYRGSAVPALEGMYLYADYVTGTIWALSYDSKTGKATRNEQVVPESIPVLAFGEDAAGEEGRLLHR